MWYFLADHLTRALRPTMSVPLRVIVAPELCARALPSAACRSVVGRSVSLQVLDL